MSFVRLVEFDELQGTARDMAESGLAQYGQLLNTWRALLHRPDLFTAYLPFLRQVAGAGEVPLLLKDLIAMYVGVLNHCRYTTSHRAAAALTHGATDELLRQVASGDWAELDEQTRVALEATRELTLLPPTTTYGGSPQALTAETRDGLSRLFVDSERMDIVFTIAVWNGLARFHRAMDLPLDMPPAPTGVEPA